MNGIMLQSFEWYSSEKGDLWKRIALKAPQLSAMGITAVWLPPAYKGMGGIHDVGYGVYDLYDLGEFDQKGTIRTKYGTKEEYIECIRQLQANGMQAIADIVLGQRLGGDQEESVMLTPVWRDNRRAAAGEPFMGKAVTRFTYEGRGGKWSDKVWDAESFTAVDYFRGCITNDRVYLLPGKRFAEDTDKEFGNYDYLMGCDPDYNNPMVRAELKRWGAWYLTQTGVDGFRLDAVKHISADFYREWLKDLRLFTGKELFTVGEYWHYDIHVLMDYLKQQDFAMSLFDVPLHHHFKEAASQGENYDLRRLFDDTLTFNRPTQAVTFVDNHDTQPGQALESWIDTWFKPIAYALILLRSVGYPCVFYGDLYGLRRAQIAPVKGIRDLMRLRRTNALGNEHTYFDDPHCIGFTREGDATSVRNGLAVLCSNNRVGEKRMFVGKDHAGERWQCVIGNGTEVVIDASGTGYFDMRGGDLCVWIPKPGLMDILKQKLKYLLKIK